MKNIGLIILALGITVGLVSFRSTNQNTTKQVSKEAKIEWLTLEEAYKRTQKQPRKIFIDLYTDWCGWCKVMDKNTFRNAEVIDFANKKYYAVKYNPEKDADVKLGNVSFKALMNGKVTGYPTTVIMDENMNLIQPIAGYLEPRVFHQILTFFGANHHQKEDFEKFKTNTYPKYTSKSTI